MPTAEHAESADARRKFYRVVNALSRNRGVTVGEGKGFGSGALKVDGKIFAMLSADGQFVVKLPKKRVDELVASSAGKRFEPRPGKPMKEWLVVTMARADWTKFANQACEFVRSGKP